MDNHYLNKDNNGNHYGKRDAVKESLSEEKASIARKRDEDLIIEENTIYEIDRDCYDRLKKQRKRR